MPVMMLSRMVAPVAASWRITLPHEAMAPREWRGLEIRWEEMPLPGHEWGASGSEKLDPASGAPRRAVYPGEGLLRPRVA